MRDSFRFSFFDNYTMGYRINSGIGFESWFYFYGRTSQGFHFYLHMICWYEHRLA